MPAPQGSSGRAGRIAYKTGTSYRFRDGWAIGFSGSTVMGVWMGRADGGTCPSCVGAAAARVLFRLFDLLSPDPLPRRTLEPVFAGPPPPALLRLEGEGTSSDSSESEGLHITFPVTQSRILVDLATSSDRGSIKLAASGGQRPYRWLVNGRPIESRPFAREAVWGPDGEGFSTVIVIDARGHSDRATIRIMGRGEN
jgi:penicillin-binding protein 1C